MFIAIVALLAFTVDSLLSEYFVYQRQLISQGEVWRFLSGHFFHTNGYHLLLNIMALLLLLLLHSKFYTIKRYSLLFLFCAVFCSLALYLFEPSLIQYVGLSGVLHGVFAWGALMDVRHGDKTGYLLLSGVIVKILHEQYYGANNELSELINASVAINAHLWGAIAGLIFFILYPVLFSTTKLSTPSSQLK
ncbi:rhombosortase [Colwellia asteriadis]|uniref:Rhombosortase n=1 Tax=Colwellia asteriadis TaxID=517723 RepID=A0ABN1L8W0_9GAMM